MSDYRVRMKYDVICPEKQIFSSRAIWFFFIRTGMVSENYLCNTQIVRSSNEPCNRYFFSSDNGAPLSNDGHGNGPLRDGKTTTWEGGVSTTGQRPHECGLGREVAVSGIIICRCFPGQVVGSLLGSSWGR